MKVLRLCPLDFLKKNVFKMTMSKKQRWNDRQVKKYTGLHLFQSATLVTTNVPRTGLGSNPDLRGDRLVTERPSYGTAYD